MIQILLALIVSITLMIVLMRKVGFHPFFSLLIAALVYGLLSGQLFADIISTMQTGFGSLLAQIGFVVTLGSCLGMMMEKTGAMEVLSLRIVKAFGPKRAILSMSSIGLLVGIPVFCDSGFIILSRLIPSIAAQAAVAPGQLALALSSGLYTTHILVPPTPGPLAAATTYGLSQQMGIVILTGIVASIPVGLVAYLLARKFGLAIPEAQIHHAESNTQKRVPFWLAITPLVLPIILIALAPLIGLMPSAKSLHAPLSVVGQPVIALSIGLCFSMIPLISQLKAGNENVNVKEWLAEAIKDAGVILLITGAGGAFGSVIKTSGVDILLKEQFSGLESGGVAVLLATYLIAAVLKTAQGSSTSSMIITSSLIAPIAASTGFASPLEYCALVLATGAGAMTVSHANDSFFWVISQFGKINPADTLRTYTVITSIQGLTALTISILLLLIA